MIKDLRIIVRFYRHVYMEAVSGLILQRLWRKIRKKAVPVSHGTHHGTEGQSVVRRRKGVRISEIYFILTGAFFMM